MILRAMGLGLLLWLANAAIFFFLGDQFFLPSPNMPMIMFAAAAGIGLVVGFVLLKLLKEAKGDEGEAAISIAFPSLVLNAYLTYDFPTIFPKLDEGLDTVFGIASMAYAAGMLFVGLLLAHLAPQDERI